MAAPKKPVSKKAVPVKPRSYWYSLIPILIAAAALRFYNNTAVALWHDEAFSALYIKYSWGEMMYRIGLDVHPPLYYWVLRLWSYVFGNGLLSLRSLSILFGVLTVYVGYLFVKKALDNEKLALLAALFIAINPFQIQYSLEARMYTLGTFLALLSSYLLIKALASNKTSHWVYYAFAVAAAMYTHYYLVFTLLAQGIYFVYYIIREKNWTWKGWASYGLSIVLYLPWIPTLLEQLRRVQSGYWITAPDRWSVPGTVWKMIFGGEGINRPTLLITSMVTVGIIFYFFRETKLRTRWLIILSLLIPFAAAVGLSFKQAIYLDRYFVFASLYFSILLAGVIYLIPKYTTRRTLATIFVVVSVFVFFKNWEKLAVKNLFLQRQYNFKPGMAKASERINENAQENDKIYVGSSFIFFTFKYYNHTPIKPLLVSSGSIETIPHFSGTAILTNEDLILDFKQTKKDDTIWLLWTTGFGGSKPNVPGNWAKINQWEYPDTPGFKGDIIVTQYRVN